MPNALHHIVKHSKIKLLNNFKKKIVKISKFRIIYLLKTFIATGSPPVSNTLNT